MMMAVCFDCCFEVESYFRFCFLDISQSDDSIQFDNKPRKKSHFELERERRLIREEERDIKAYEKLLKLKSYRKRNRLPKSFYLDGLGELIELCDNKKYENRIATDDDEDAPKNLQESDNESDMASGSDFSDENENDESEEMNEDSEVDDELEFDDQTKSNTRRNASRVIDNEGRYEDIYGIVRNKDGEILEAEATKEKKLTIDLDVVVDENVQRKLRGLLNRLTAENIKPISSQIVELYRTYSRYMINKGIFCCIENLVINAQHNVSCKIVSEISLLIAYLHVEIGEEVGGYFIHSIICQFDSAFKDTTQSDVKLNNIIIMILNMYATGLLDSRVVYDIIEMFCKRFDEKSIEIIDLILKSSGFMLRKDDAAKMKSLIIDIQKLSSNVDLSGTGNRIKFILESLNAIKNNNMTKLKSSTTVVMTELIEETLKSLLKKSKVPTIPGQYSEVIQSSSWFSFTKNIISLEPINQKDKASDSEYIFDDRHVDFEMRDRICRALRINTPLRKDLFTAIFQCNDYIDAACKLISIGKKQFSEVINLIIHVALNEKNYNPFYYHLLQHLSTCDRKYKVISMNFLILLNKQFFHILACIGFFH